jgi:hypothetical protein
VKGYSGVGLSNSACVRFVRNSEIDGSEQEIFDDARQRGTRIVYVDASKCEREIVANVVASAIQLDHAPYQANYWVCFLDDLISLAYREQGLIIVVDNADALFELRRAEFFDLVEAFLTQFHHWIKQSKPCHLCLQMESNVLVSRFVQFAAGVPG